jgi:hypothetical protein
LIFQLSFLNFCFQVPVGKSDVFNSSLLTMLEKRLLMKMSHVVFGATTGSGGDPHAHDPANQADLQRMIFVDLFFTLIHFLITATFVMSSFFNLDSMNSTYSALISICTFLFVVMRSRSLSRQAVRSLSAVAKTTAQATVDCCTRTGLLVSRCQQYDVHIFGQSCL